RLRQDGPRHSAGDHRQVQRRTGRSRDTGGGGGRGARYDRGRLRAVPDPGRLSQSDAARAHGHAAGVRPLRPRAARRRVTTDPLRQVGSRAMVDLGRWLIVFGLVLVGVGLLLTVAGRIPWLGRLPGDIYYKSDHVTVYFPLVTCLLVSVVVSVLLY